MQVTLDVPAYSPETGLRLHWVEGGELAVTLQAGAVCVRGNPAGLTSLAGHLLNLAQAGMPVGHHLHLDEYNALEEGSLEVILERG